MKNKYNMKCEILDVEGAVNVRDIGGYCGSDSRVTKKRRFIRSGSLGGLTKRGIQTLRETGIKCVIDLRSNAEIQTCPNAFRKDDEIHYLHIPLLDHIQSNISDNNFSMFPVSLEIMYEQLLQQDGEKFRQAFEAFADERYPVCLFHCTAGKDRTGLLAMLLLGLAGVSDADIAEDYSWSELYSNRAQMQNVSPEFPRYLFESKPETMLTLLAFLKREYGGVSAYLTQIGVTQTQKDAVIKKLFD